MNRYVITKEAIRGQEYMVSALYDEQKKMIEVQTEPVTQAALLGNIYIARVENIVKNLNAAFVRISPEQNCYLPLEDVKHPVFTKKISGKKALAAGDEVVVQIVREALKSKEPAVTTNLSFTGTYAVITTGNRRAAVSSKLSKEQRAHYLELLLGMDTEEYGVIIRTNAAEVPDDIVLAEVSQLAEQYRKLVETAEHRTCYSLLYREPAGYFKHLDNIRQNMLEEIVTDDREIFVQICAKYGILPEQLTTKGSVPVLVHEVRTAGHIRIRHHEDAAITLSSLYSVKAGIEEALKERVWLKSGAYLVIQPTEALTVIDVNTGKNVAKKNAQENFLKVNKEAALEIARQLRLRNISGMILVDFMNLKSKDAEAELLSIFRAALKKDPVPAQLVDMTKLGLVEVTRKKVRKPLAEVL